MPCCPPFPETWGRRAVAFWAGSVGETLERRRPEGVNDREKPWAVHSAPEREPSMLLPQGGGQTGGSRPLGGVGSPMCRGGRGREAWGEGRDDGEGGSQAGTWQLVMGCRDGRLEEPVCGGRGGDRSVNPVEIAAGGKCLTTNGALYESPGLLVCLFLPL